MNTDEHGYETFGEHTSTWVQYKKVHPDLLTHCTRSQGGQLKKVCHLCELAEGDIETTEPPSGIEKKPVKGFFTTEHTEYTEKARPKDQ